jgi:hypothetical protein
MRRRLLALTASSALHLVAVMVAVIESAAPPRVSAPPPGNRAMSVFALDPDDDSAPPGLRSIDSHDADDLRPPAGSSSIAVPGFAFDVAKIEARAALLFPFLTPGISLERFALAPRIEPRDTFRDPFAPQPAARPPAARKPPLAMTAAALQTLVDQCWSRRDRWTPFQRIAKIAGAHNADAGRLPALLHEYQSQDGLQPYVDGSIRDPRMWTELGLAADHVEFIGFISRYAAEHPSTKATTELLFLLDQIAQASLDALATLLATIPDEHLDWTRSSNPDAFEFIIGLQRHYAAELLKKGLTSGERLTEYYDRVRLNVLTGILRTTPHGYRANDARFLIGSIDWRQGNFGDAVRAWRQMSVDPTDTYATAISRIVGAIAAETAGDRGNVDAAQTTRLLTQQINAVLRAEHGRWIMFSLDRLHQFGFRFDSF